MYHSMMSRSLRIPTFFLLHLPYVLMAMATPCHPLLRSFLFTLHQHSHMLYVWYIYLQNWVNLKANVGKYSMHGAYGISMAWHFHG